MDINKTIQGTFMKIKENKNTIYNEYSMKLILSLFPIPNTPRQRCPRKNNSNSHYNMISSNFLMYTESSFWKINVYSNWKGRNSITWMFPNILFSIIALYVSIVYTMEDIYACKNILLMLGWMLLFYCYFV